jgi:hypothetical protein
MAYAQAYVYSEEETHLYVGVSSDDSIQVLLNQEEIHIHSVARTGGPACSPQDLFAGPAILREGENHLLIKVFDGGGGWSFALQFHDRSGSPVTEGLIVAKVPLDGCRIPPVKLTRIVETGGLAGIGARVERTWSEPGGTFPVSLEVAPPRDAVGKCFAAGPFTVREKVPEGWIAENPSAGGTIAGGGGEVVWELDAAEGLPGGLHYSVTAGERREDVVFEGTIEEPGAPSLFRIRGDRRIVYAPAPFERGQSIVILEADFDDDLPGRCPPGWTCNTNSLGSIPFAAGVTDEWEHEGRLRLSAEQNYIASSVIWSEPIDLRGSSFTAEFDLYMSKLQDQLPGDGMTFVVLDSELHEPTAVGESGALGYPHPPGSFAVELDTWSSGSDPSGYSDPSAPYGHVGLLRDGCTSPHVQTHLDLDRRHCPAETDEWCQGWPEFVDMFGTGIPLHVEVDYNNGWIQVWLSVSEVEGGWEPAFPRTLVLDTVITFPEPVMSSAYLGFTAGTGGLTTVQEVDNVLVTLFEATDVPPPVRFLRGDCNGDADTGGVTDAVYLLSYNFLGAGTPPCLAACDANGDGDIGGVTDAVYLLTYNFLGGRRPPDPFPECGPETLPPGEALDCETPPAGCPVR